ncbi:MAG: NADH-quinone oxidoreductase subunit NuoH [bacterium]|nr:NADH-quinone oxidoreductase subunit NuoH [bacterium]
MPEPLLQFLIIPLVKVVVILVVLMLIVAYATFAERKFLSYMQVRIGPNRVGPKGWLQPIADGLKLFVKEDLVPTGASKAVFMIAPCLIMATALLVWSVIPFAPATDLFGLLDEPIEPFLTNINIALLFILGVSGIGVYGIILGGWSSNNKFSLMGGLRAGAQMISYEVPMGFAIVAILLMAGSLSLVDIVNAQAGAWGAAHWYIWPGILAFGIYFICGVAEVNRNPFDLPEAEAELVGGFHTEYSGMKFALFFMAEYANMVLISSLAVVMFFGGWLAPFPGLGFVPPVLWFIGKVFCFMFVYIWFRGTFPRYRFDQLMHIGWKWLLPLSLANVVVVALGVLVVNHLKG